MATSVQVQGLPEVTAALTELSSAAAAFDGAYATVGTNLSYARMVHDGTRPHRIAASNKRALSWPGAAHPVRSVQHPGYRGNPFLTDALQDQLAAIRTQLLAVLELIAARQAPASALAAALYGAGLLVEGGAKARANVRTGTLRRSIVTDVFTRF